MTRKYSSEYKQYQPYVVEDIRKVVGAVGGSATGGSGMQVHTLSGPYHSGELAQSQASWAATKVELSSHAALPDVHHAKLHAITDTASHSVTGSQYQIVGLTAVNTLGLLTPSASPAANAVVKTDGSSGVTLVDLTVTSDLFMSGYLDFGTDVMYEDASYLQVTGSKAVRFGQNIGNANWTVFNAGGASFGGNVDIISGGDLTVIGSGAYAGNQVLFVDSSGGNVGIMRAPDSQFALDINGPARATYWIGPHAIQLKGVLMLAHFDGRAPYETNYSGDLNGHMGQVGSPVGGLIFRPGKFYKAAQVAVSTTNLIANPSFEVDTSGWNCTAGTATRTTAMSVYGSYSILLAASGASGILISTATINVTSGVTYTLSAWVYISSATGTARMDLNDKPYEVEVTTTVKNQWVRLVCTFTPTSTGTITPRFFTSDSAVFYVDGIQLEQKNYVTPYCDGSLGGYSGSGVPDGTGHAWTGTAHASTSSRTSAAVTYPVSGNINVSSGTIMAWVWVDGHDSTGNEGIVDAGSAWTYFELWMNSGTTPSAIVGNASGYAQAVGPAAAVRQWVHVAMTWAGSTLTVYTNGVAGTPVAYTNQPLLAATFAVGSLPSLGSYRLNGCVDDLVILDRAATATEISAVYESDAPVFAETSTFTFRPTPKGLIWADDEGLWMRDTVGNSVLGVYGGEAATKSWAGFTLAAGDIVFGRNAVGSSAIWWDQSAGKFGFYGAGSGTPQVEIATDGRLTAGAGKVALDSTGFKAYNAALVETININATGIYMGDGGARTTIASWTSGGRIQFYSVGEAYEATPETYLDDSSISRTLYPLVIRGVRQGNDAALIELAAVRSDTGAGAKIIIGEGFRLKDYFTGSGSGWNTNRVVHAIADDIILQSSKLQLSGQTTNTTQSTGVGTIKMAGATNRNNTGLLQVIIGGNVVYIPYFATITG